ncbi:hydroxyisourate hydrolase [Nocardiopsis sp. CT-R113]|uniref:5-hydroxyisourate hydrolase n=1 Tax=Nocardiopsis codii TaxID=3065942 RepID=A0ABU7K1A8_9ACTN|nr:hydroxyisourate hydrolase [Nocardiopsis sp. CT-R113]MEE2035624.1 hydroxyisourate hydrolase [Nocardiopsis sp. CT-R113]
MSHVTTHILDTALGAPARGVPVRLESAADGRRASWKTLAEGRTDDDGRVPDLGPDRLATGTYRLVFDTAAYFAADGRTGFFPEVTVAFDLTEEQDHYHVPLLLSPYSYSTYRGS